TLGVIRVPLAWLWAGSMGPSGVWQAFAVSNVLGAVIALAWFRSSRWKSTLLSAEGQAQGQVAEEAEEYEDTVSG
ncbi:MAG: MATE family efflux transporter, partial [Candidatus Nanohaloarchaea archaeon]